MSFLESELAALPPPPFNHELDNANPEFPPPPLVNDRIEEDPPSLSGLNACLLWVH